MGSGHVWLKKRMVEPEGRQVNYCMGVEGFFRLEAYFLCQKGSLPNEYGHHQLSKV